MKWTVKSQSKRRVVQVEAALWYEAREIGSRIFGCSPMDLEVEPVKKPAQDP